MSDQTNETPGPIDAPDTAATAEAIAPSATPEVAEGANAPGRRARTADGEPASRRARKVREGVVVSSKMDRTAVVAVIERVRHPKYGKFVQRTKKLYAHDEANDAGIGDRVRLMETRPLSKLKRWRVIEVLERAR